MQKSKAVRRARKRRFKAKKNTNFKMKRKSSKVRWEC